MDINIDFSIFESPVRAFGNVTGTLEVASPPQLGSMIPFIGRRGLVVEEGFTGFSQVISITPVDGQPPVFGLDDVVVSSHSSASLIARRLSEEMNLFVIEYDHDSRE